MKDPYGHVLEEGILTFGKGFLKLTSMDGETTYFSGTRVVSTSDVNEQRLFGEGPLLGFLVMPKVVCEWWFYFNALSTS